MDRRHFLSVAGTTTALAGCVGAAAALNRPEPGDTASGNAPRKERRPVRMHVGTQRKPTSPEILQFVKRHGVDHICGYPPDPGDRGYWTVDDLEKTRDLCEQHAVTLDIVALPFLKSSHIDREERGAIMLGKSPERERDIEHINIMTVNCAKVGIPCWKYNMSLLGVLRTESTPGRGGSSYSTWKLADAKADPKLTRAGRVSEDEVWERITYFLDRVIPVCNEYKIRAACHPHDPGVPKSGWQGLPRVLGTVDGLKKFVSIQDSPYHGLNLCLGSVAEGLQNPAAEINDVIRWFGERNKIFNIHYRNIRGRRDDFQEVYLDNGELDMLGMLRTLYEVDYEYMVMPDHVPRHPDDPGGRQAFAFAYGYIKALMQAIEAGA
jgi:mannonate dehydratase